MTDRRTVDVVGTLPKPYYEDDAVTIYHGDCREVIPSLPFDAVVTDPPYGVNAEYKPRGVHTGERAAWDERVPYDLLTDFLPRPVVWFGSPARIVESVRTFEPPPDRVLIWAPRFTLAMASNGGIAYRYHPVYAWNLPNARPTVHDVFTPPTEAGNWWDHLATKPVVLMRQLIPLVGEGVVLDPFMGSGTTLRAAKDLGRKAVGVEVEERYCEIAAKRMAQEVLAV